VSWNFDVTISAEKSTFCVKRITYLGFVLSRDGISIDEQKQSAIRDAPFPTTAKALHRLLGAAVWLSRVLPCNLSNLAAPLRKFLLQRPHDKSYIHPYDPDDPMIRRTVGALKERIANAVLLHSPDWERPYHLFVDASPAHGAGFLLAQWYDANELPYGVDLPPQDNTEQKLPEDTVPPAPLDTEGNPRQGAFVPIYFGSKSLSPDVQGKWDTAEAECWAIVCGLRKFSAYLYGSKGTIVHSDHANLEYLKTFSKEYSKLQRWLTYIELFNVRFEFTRGLSMGIADYLSRACTPDDSLPDDGEADKDKISTDSMGNVVVDALTARYQFCELYGAGDSCDVTPSISVEAVGPLPTVNRPTDEYTMFSACGGIGSGQIAADHAGLKVKSIGMSDVDEERIAIYQKANPNVPVYGALGAVTAALECGDLVLDPTILELTTPCQAHSHFVRNGLVMSIKLWEGCLAAWKYIQG
jgi:hypothetical protein